MSSVTLNVPEVPATEPTVPALNPIVIDLAPGAAGTQVDLDTITNNGNVARTFTMSVTNLVDCTVSRVGISVDNATPTFTSGATTMSQVIQPNKSVRGVVTFKVVPGAPEQPGFSATADYSYSWSA